MTATSAARRRLRRHARLAAALVRVVSSCGRLGAATLVVLSVAAGVASSSAVASQVARVERCSKGICQLDLQFIAQRGEANRVTAELVGSRGEVRVVDGGAQLGAGSGCVQVDTHTAVCTSEVWHAVSV